MGLVTERCWSCKYSCANQTGYNNHYVGAVTCDYFLKTGRRRPCEAGDDCTEYTPGKTKFRIILPRKEQK